jgi:hypothetical protein
MIYVDPSGLPIFEGEPVHPNLFVLGVIMGHTGLNKVIRAEDVEQVIRTRFKRGGDANLFAFRSGMALPQVSV